MEAFSVESRPEGKEEMGGGETRSAVRGTVIPTRSVGAVLSELVGLEVGNDDLGDVRLFAADNVHDRLFELAFDGSKIGIGDVGIAGTTDDSLHRIANAVLFRLISLAEMVFVFLGDLGKDLAVDAHRASFHRVVRDLVIPQFELDEVRLGMSFFHEGFLMLGLRMLRLSEDEEKSQPFEGHESSEDQKELVLHQDGHDEVVSPSP